MPSLIDVERQYYVVKEKFWDWGSGPILDAYEKVLLDCMLGDQMLFWRQDGVERSWSFLTPILSCCENTDEPQNVLHFYEAGSGGPLAAQALLQTDSQGH